MPSSADSFLRQLSGKEAWKSSSRRWGGGSSKRFDGCGRSLKQVEGLNMYGSYIDGLSSEENGGGGLGMRKRVMVVVDNSSYSKHAMIWALTHVTNKADLLTLLHIIPPSHSHTASDRAASSSSNPADLASSLGSLCKACKPEMWPGRVVLMMVDGSGGGGSIGDTGTKASDGDEPGEEAGGFGAGAGAEEALFVPPLSMWKQRGRGFCGAVHQRYC
ncbi:uncharacterized protein LOC131162516 isoform X2 [Malania oleifera]|uniref:uncharacterized protein LOC131162516 isoform X2 n=1 Tax=Malania oleifera TaxID=397392 RepID=UPI0025AE8DEE|nr:uncharacterized protein LOC131162516 isoform X2 [Malania oleifera]